MAFLFYTLILYGFKREKAKCKQRNIEFFLEKGAKTPFYK